MEISQEEQHYNFIRYAKLTHFLSRLMERFGIIYSREDIPLLAEEIESYNSKPIIIYDNGSSLHPVTLKGEKVIVLYDWEYRVPLSAFRPSWFKQLPDGTWINSKGPKSKTINYNNRKTTNLRKIKGY